MIYVSEKGIRIILIIFLIGFSLFVIYFINEIKKVESIYDNISYEIDLK